VPPEFEDCRTTCSTDVEPPRDAEVSPPPIDATRPPDDAPPPKPTGTLRVKIADKGRVDVLGVGSCDPEMDPCDFIVELGVARTLVAIPYGNREFEKWDKACHGTLPTCIVVPTMPMTQVDAKFRKD
jgi:hypothetical protein